MTLGAQAQLDVQIKLGDRNACTNSTLLFLDSIVSGTPISYEWISSVATFTSVGSSITQASFTASGNVILKSQDATTTFYDTVYVTLNTPPVVTLSNDLEVCCNYGSIDLNQSVIAPTDTSYTSVWRCLENPGVIDDTVFLTSDACGLIKQPSSLARNTIVYTCQDPATQCVNSDSLTITVRSLPSILLEKRSYCQDVSAIQLEDAIVISPANTALGTSSWRCLDSNAAINNFTTDMLENRGFDFAPDWWLNFSKADYVVQNEVQDTLELEFTYTNAFGCTSKDTVKLVIRKVPKLSFNSHRDLCIDEGDVSLKSVMSVNLTDGMWTVLDTSAGILFRDPADLGGISSGDTINTLVSTPLTSASETPNSWVIRYVHTASGCPIYKDTFLRINPLPNLVLNRIDDRYCDNNSDVLLQATPSGSSGIWSASDPSAILGGNRFSPSSATTKGAEITLLYTYSSPTTGCSNVDSISTWIDAAPLLNLPAEDSFCYLTSGIPVSKSFTISSENSAGLTWFASNEYGNLSRISVGTLSTLNPSTGDITFTPERDRDTFRIATVAAGQGSCPSYTEFFDVLFYLDPDCILSTSSVNEIQAFIYPNPNKGTFTITGSLNLGIHVTDILGKNVNFDRDQETIRIESKGLYFITLTDTHSGLRYTKKVVVK